METVANVKSPKINYTENDRAIVAVLKASDRPMTLAGINAAANINCVAGHIVSAMKKGLIAKAGEVDVTKPGARKVSTYNFVTAEVLNKADGKPFNYTEGEKEILAVAATIESPFTLEDLSKAMNRKITSGSTNGLIKKGNLTKGDQVTVACMTKTTVSTYVFVKDIPTDAE